MPGSATAAGRGAVLLALARESLAEAFELGRVAARDDGWLREPGACFVTLRRLERLRGCVGSTRAYRPLHEDVCANARAAAFNDSRFAPLAAQELPEVRLEVSLLGPLAPLHVTSEEEAMALLRPGVDGVVFGVEGRRSTFLPQVWEQLQDPRQFLAQLKRKAGLPPDFWSPTVEIWRYTVEKWVEGEG